LETAYSQPSIPAVTSFVNDLQTKLKSGPDVVSIPLTESEIAPKSISVYRRQEMVRKPSYSDTTSNTETFPMQRTSSEKSEGIHNALHCTLFFRHT